MHSFTENGKSVSVSTVVLLLRHKWLINVVCDSLQNGIVVFSRCITGREEKRKKKTKSNYAYCGTGDEVLTILAMA